MKNFYSKWINQQLPPRSVNNDTGHTGKFSCVFVLYTVLKGDREQSTHYLRTINSLLENNQLIT